MSDEKIQWSEQQPEDWKGAPLGTPSEWPAPVTPPVTPAAPVGRSNVPVGAAVNASWKLLKSQYHRYLAISAAVLGLSAIAACAVVGVFRANNLASDEVIILLVNRASSEVFTQSELDLLSAQWSGLLYVFLPPAIIAVIAQLVAQVLISARALSRVSSTPEVPALKFAWWPVITNQLAYFAVIVGAFIPAAVVIFFAGSNAAMAMLALLLVLAYLVFIIWFAIVSMMSLQHSVATGAGGFACIKQTIALSKGARAASFVSVLIMGLGFALVGSFITSSLDTAFVNASLDAQVYWLVVSQFLGAILSVPATTIALSATYSLRRSIQ
ncbi:MAG: hypothetical protein RIS43_574 [Actinomycetota bacterium]|jgi:hypothetical protein